MLSLFCNVCFGWAQVGKRAGFWRWNLQASNFFVHKRLVMSVTSKVIQLGTVADFVHGLLRWGLKDAERKTTGRILG